MTAFRLGDADNCCNNALIPAPSAEDGVRLVRSRLNLRGLAVFDEDLKSVVVKGNRDLAPGKSQRRQHCDTEQSRTAIIECRSLDSHAIGDVDSPSFTFGGIE